MPVNQRMGGVGPYRLVVIHAGFRRHGHAVTASEWSASATGHPSPAAANLYRVYRLYLMYRLYPLYRLSSGSLESRTYIGTIIRFLVVMRCRIMRSGSPARRGRRIAAINLGATGASGDAVGSVFIRGLRTKEKQPILGVDPLASAATPFDVSVSRTCCRFSPLGSEEKNISKYQW